MKSRLKRLQEAGVLGHIEPFIYESVQYEVMMGSVAYGVSTDTSDIDLYGFCIPPQGWVFPHLRGEIPGFGKPGPKFEQFQKHHVSHNKNSYDLSIYSIVKYISLVADNNPNMVDSLFVPRNCILYATQLGEMVRSERRAFLHKGCYHRFKGYAYAQMKKLETKNPTGKRAERVAEHGYDTKFAYHIVRLLDECEQILESGDVDLTRDRERLKAIRAGDWTLERVKDFFEQKEKHLEDCYANTSLPYAADEERIKALLLNCLEQHYGSLKAVGGDDQLRAALSRIETICREVGPCSG